MKFYGYSSRNNHLLPVAAAVAYLITIIHPNHVTSRPKPTPTVHPMWLTVWGRGVMVIKKNVFLEWMSGTSRAGLHRSVLLLYRKLSTFSFTS